MRKISESEASQKAIDRILADVPEKARGYVVLRTIQAAGGVMRMMYPQFEICPHCGHNRLEVEAHNGHRVCRSCREWFPEKAVV